MWFAASIFYRGQHQHLGSEHDLWEESIVLVEANDETQAELHAERIARESFAYKTATSDEMRWVFDSVDRVYSIGDAQLRHGDELFSRFLRPSEVTSLKTPFAETE
jgi:hypothetical protein